MSRTIKAIERHIAPRAMPAVLQPSAVGLVAEWQQRGPETISGYTIRKLRLALRPSQSVMTAIPSW